MRVDWALVGTLARMHDDELAIDAALVRRLLAAQTPSLAERPVRAFGARGTVNAMFRLGQDLVVRLPRTAAWTGDLEAEWLYLPQLRGRITLRVPEPVALGEPSPIYPLPWAVYRWLEGSPYDDALVADEAVAATDLARFVRELRSGPVEGVRATGRRPLAELDAATRAAVAEADDLLDGGAVWPRGTAPLRARPSTARGSGSTPTCCASTCWCTGVGCRP